jgi:hypothetical protein
MIMIKGHESIYSESQRGDRVELEHKFGGHCKGQLGASGER